jgi:Protein of unknown function (DUF2637)
MNTSKIRAIVTSRRFATASSVSIVAAVAGYNSYGHQYDVAIMAHQPAHFAAALPFSVDGMLLAASVAMAEDKAEGRKPRLWAVVAFWLGAAVSVSANVASVIVHYGFDWLAIGVSAWPPVALLITVEVLTRKGRPVKNPNRVEGGRRAAATRATTTKKRPAGRRKPAAAPTAPAAAPVSPGVGPVGAYAGRRA